MTQSGRWTRRPDASTWGDFGPDDQLGRLNTITRENVLLAAAEVREGLSFCLSLPLDHPGGNELMSSRFPPVLRPTLRNGRSGINYESHHDVEGATDIVSDDVVTLYLQYSTHWDSLAHVGQHFDADGDGEAEPVYYNGYRAGVDIAGPSGDSDTTAVSALGVENMAAACVQGRGVMVDLHAHVGRKNELVGYDELMRIIEADGVTVEPGDMVCLHTGFGDLLLELGGSGDTATLRNSCSALDGRDSRLLDWIGSSGLSVLVSDNFAVEAVPARVQEGPGASLPLHEHCLFKLGVNLGELWYLTDLAGWLREHGRNRFLLTAPPLRLPGAVGSPTTPVATV